MEEVEEQSSTGENETTTPLGLDGDVFMGVAGVTHMRDALLEIIHG